MQHERTTTTHTSTLDREKVEKVWNVIVHDDPVTAMAYVTLMFRKIFGYSNNKATKLMLDVHHHGRAAVWQGARDRAESYCVKLQVAGLLSTVEQGE